MFFLLTKEGGSTFFFLKEKRDVYFSCAKQEKYQKKFASVPLERSVDFTS